MICSDMDTELTTGQTLVHDTIGKTLLTTCTIYVNINSVVALLLRAKVRFAQRSESMFNHRDVISDPIKTQFERI